MPIKPWVWGALLVLGGCAIYSEPGRNIPSAELILSSNLADDPFATGEDGAKSANRNDFYAFGDASCESLLGNLGMFQARDGGRKIVRVEAGDRGELALWSIADRALVRSWKSHDKAITLLAFSADGGILAAGGDEDTVRLWSVPKGKELREIDDLDGATIGLAFSPDGTLLAIGSRLKGVGGQVRVWSVPRKRFIAEKPCLLMVPVVRLAYSADGKRLVYSCSTFLEKGTSLVRVMDIESEKITATIHREVMTQGVLLMPDGQRLITLQKQELNAGARSAMNQSIAVWAIAPPGFINYLHDPAAKP